MTSMIHNLPAFPARSRARRAITALVALGALAVTPSALAKGGAQIKFFTYDVAGTPSTLLDELTCARGASHGRRVEELKPLLTATPLQQVMVSLVSDGDAVEAEVFTEDPSIQASRMRKVAQNALSGNDPYGDGWLEATRTSLDSCKVNLPSSVVVPYPNQDVLLQQPGQPPLDAQVFLDPSKFVGGSPHALDGTAAIPQGQGSVKGLRVHDHGFCSATRRLAPMYEDAQAQLWKGAKEQAAGIGADAEQYYTAAVTILDRDVGQPSTELRDGFQLGGRLHIWTPDMLLDMDASAFMEAELFVKEGHLRARYMGKPMVSDGNAEPQVVGMFDQILNRVGEIADEAQTMDLLGGDDLTKLAVPCVPDDPDPCAKAALALGEVVGLGVKSVELSYGVTLDSERLSKSVQDPDLWSCVATEGADGKPSGESECRLFVPAKRINMYPDELELVWFDDLDEQDNAALAVWVAGNASGDPAALAQLCEPRRDYRTVDFTQRMYATAYSGYEYAPAP